MVLGPLERGKDVVDGAKGEHVQIERDLCARVASRQLAPPRAICEGDLEGDLGPSRAISPHLAGTEYDPSLSFLSVEMATPPTITGSTHHFASEGDLA